MDAPYPFFICGWTDVHTSKIKLHVWYKKRVAK
jgi:hypothetical protein